MKKEGIHTSTTTETSTTSTDTTTETTADTSTETTPETISTDIEALVHSASHQDLMSYFGTDTAGAIKHYTRFWLYRRKEKSPLMQTPILINNSDLADFFSARNGYTTTEAIIKGALKHFIDYGHEEGRTHTSTTTETSTSTDTSTDSSNRLINNFY